MEPAERVNLGFIGAKGSGKSCLLGTLMVSTIPEMERYVKKMDEEYKMLWGRNGVHKKSYFQWIIDKLRAEREREETLRMCILKLDDRITMVSCSGNLKYDKTICRAISFMDYCLFVVPMDRWEELINEDARQIQAQMAFSMGTHIPVVVFTKMDKVEYSQEVFEKMVKAYSLKLSVIGYDANSISFIPVSALDVQNIIEPSEAMGWYKGPALYPALTNIPSLYRPYDLPFRMNLYDVHKISGIGTVVVGKVTGGLIKPGNKLLTIKNSKTVGEMKSIEQHHEALNQALPGNIVGINIRGVSCRDAGNLMAFNFDDKLPSLISKFEAEVFFYDILNMKVEAGFNCCMYVANIRVGCFFTEFLEEVNKQGEGPIQTKTGGRYRAVVKLCRPEPLTTWKENQIYATFLLRNSSKNIGEGKITRILEDKPMTSHFI